MTTLAERVGTYTGLRAIWQTLNAAAPTVAFFAALLGVTAAWQHLRPAAFPPAHGRLEVEIIQTQRERALSIPEEVDVLMVGDSSGMMGINATLLSELLEGARVESLNTLGMVPPAGTAAILERFLKRPGRTRRLLITMHPNSLTMRPGGPIWARVAIQGTVPHTRTSGPIAGIRARLLALVEPILYLPMEGRLGQYYGTAAAFGEFLRRHRGTAIDPRDLTRAQSLYASAIGSPCTVKEAGLRALAPLTAAIEKLGDERARFVLMPVIANRNVLEATRECENTLRRISNALGIDTRRRLQLPYLMSHHEFANLTHLNPEGRDHFTRILAAELLRDRAEYPVAD